MTLLALRMQTSCPIRPHLERRLITTLQEFSSLAEEWRALEKRVPGLLPFQCFDWNYHWWQCFADASPLHRDHLSVSCLYEHGRLVAVMPLTHRYVGIHGQYLFRYVRPFGADPNLTELRLPLALPEFQHSMLQCWSELAQHEALGISEFLVIQEHHLAEQFFARQNHLHVIEQRAIPNFILPLASDWETMRSGLKRNIKESLRRCYNSLKRDGLSATLHFTQGPAIKSQLPQFYALHRARANASDTVSHPDYFAAVKHQQFIEQLTNSPFVERMHLFSLEVENKIVAMRLGFRMNQQLYLYYSGYDLAYKNYSVMTTLLAEIIQWAIREKIPEINLSVGEDVSKTRWQPLRRDYLEYRCCKNQGWRIAVANLLAGARKRSKKPI